MRRAAMIAGDPTSLIFRLESTTSGDWVLYVQQLTAAGTSDAWHVRYGTVEEAMRDLEQNYGLSEPDWLDLDA